MRIVAIGLVFVLSGCDVITEVMQEGTLSGFRSCMREVGDVLEPRPARSHCAAKHERVIASSRIFDDPSLRISEESLRGAFENLSSNHVVTRITLMVATDEVRETSASVWIEPRERKDVFFVRPDDNVTITSPDDWWWGLDEVRAIRID